MAEVRIRDARKVYPGGVEAIKGVSCEIKDGELLVMLGPSGCGKSTLLRMVAGLEEITGGEVDIGGRVVNRLEPKDRDIAMVFQNYALYPHMSVYDNMAYGLKIARLPKAEIDSRVKEAAELLGIVEFLQRRPRQLSGGQRQRVAMGRAIVRKPQVFLFDEPLSNLDAKLRTHMRVEIKRLQRRLGVTSLYVTHDQVEAMTLGDRLMVMNAGVAEQIGTPLDVYRKPETVFVAGFIGAPAMNFLSARIVDDGRAASIGGNLTVPVATSNGNAGREVTVGLRPEHLLAGSAGSGTLPAQVELVEALGADTLVHTRLAGTGEALLARVPGGLEIRDGDTVGLTVEPGSVHLFDNTSGRRLAA